MKMQELFKAKNGVESPFRNRMFILILIIAFLNYNSMSMLAITLPKYANDLGVTSQLIGLLSGIFAMCALIMRPFSGQIVDNEDKIIMLRVCLTVVLASVVGLAFSTTYWPLLIFRGLNGLAWGVGSTLAMTIATSSFTAKNMATGIGIYGMGQTLSRTLAPLVALPIAERFGYNNLYFGNIAIMVLCVGMTFFMKRDGEETKAKIVKKYSFNIKNMIYFPSILPAALTLCNSITKSAISAFLVIYAGSMDVANIGVFFTVQAITIFAFRPIASKLADKLGTLKVLIPCELLIILGMITIAVSKTLPMFIFAAVLMGIALAGEQPILMAECIKKATPDKRGSASNTSYVGVDIGMFTGSNLAGILVAYVGYQSMYFLMTLPVVICSVLFVILFRKGKAQELSEAELAAEIIEEEGHEPI